MHKTMTLRSAILAIIVLGTVHTSATAIEQARAKPRAGTSTVQTAPRKVAKPQRPVRRPQALRPIREIHNRASMAAQTKRRPSGENRSRAVPRPGRIGAGATRQPASQPRVAPDLRGRNHSPRLSRYDRYQRPHRRVAVPRLNGRRHPYHRHVYRPHFTYPTVYGSYFYYPGYSFNFGYGPYDRPYGYRNSRLFPYDVEPYGQYRDDFYMGALRLKVKPRDAEVYVDGYYAGLIDNFDGVFQRLKLEEGPHEIEIRHPEYLPLTFKVRIIAGEKVTYEKRLKRH